MPEIQWLKMQTGKIRRIFKVIPMIQVAGFALRKFSSASKPFDPKSHSASTMFLRFCFVTAPNVFLSVAEDRNNRFVFYGSVFPSRYSNSPSVSGLYLITACSNSTRIGPSSSSRHTPHHPGNIRNYSTTWIAGGPASSPNCISSPLP